MALAYFLTISTSGVYAGESEDKLIDKIVAAYGGDKLLSAKSLNFKEQGKNFLRGQSTSPEKTDILGYSASLNIDYENKRKSFRQASGSNALIFLKEQFFDGEKGYQIDHIDKSVSIDASVKYDNFANFFSYKVDTILVQMINQARDSAALKEQVLYRGKVHHKISFKSKGYPELTLFIDPTSGLISQMTRAYNQTGKLRVYEFSNYKQQDAVYYASNTYYTSQGLPVSMTTSRSLVINNQSDAVYQTPKGYGASKDEIDSAKMNVKKLADGVYHAGQGWGFSIFVDMGEYFVASGSYHQLTQRFTAMKAYSGIDKPLKYQVVTHHHQDHQRGLKEAAKLGVKFITVQQHVAKIREQTQQALGDDRFLLVDGLGSFFENRLQVIDVETSHSQHNLISYFRETKIAFSADHFYSRQKSGAPKGDPDLKRIRDKLAAHHLDVDHFAAAHSPRLLSADDLQQAILQMQPVSCPLGWDICSQ